MTHVRRLLALLVLIAAAASPAALAGLQAASLTFVFVHGAWGGGFQFASAARRLEAEGHRVIRPSLTGLGERAHLDGPDVDLDTHVEDIVATIRFEDLRDVRLVAHSYGGMVAMGVLDAIPERVAHAVFVDAFVPHDGESMAAILGLRPEDAYQPEGVAEWQFAPPWWDPDAPDPKAVPQSLATTNQPIRLDNPLRASVRATYLLTYEDRPDADGFAFHADRARALGWEVRAVAGDHVMPWSAPAAFVDELLDIVGVRGARQADAAARDPEPTVGESIRIVSYNVHHGEGTDGRLDLERIAALIRELDPDLVALQEVDRRVERTGHVDQAERYGRLTGMAHVFGAFMPYQGGEYGMAVLSRWPIVAVANHRLPDGAEPRTALAVRVRSPRSGRELELVGVHLYRSVAERQAQAQALRSIYADAALPVILAGDFNSLPDSPVMRTIAGAWQVIVKGADRLTFPSTGPERQIDYFAVRPAEAFRVVEQRVLDEPLASDHRPLFIELAWQHDVTAAAASSTRASVAPANEVTRR